MADMTAVAMEMEASPLRWKEAKENRENRGLSFKMRKERR
jgi:hypothetical protein